jgi:hypothetical protein
VASTPPVDLTGMTPDQVTTLVRALRARVAQLLSPRSLRRDHYYQQKFAKCLAKGDSPWLHFDDILRARTINAMGIYPGVEHYPLLARAASIIPNVESVWEVGVHHRIFLKVV